MHIVVLLHPQHSYDYLKQICCQSQKDLTSSTLLCKEFRTTFYFKLGDLLPKCIKNLTDPWPEQANVTIPANESINSANSESACALPGFTSVRGSSYSPWAYACLDGWCTNRQCFLGYLSVALTVHNQTETAFWSTLLKSLS